MATLWAPAYCPRLERLGPARPRARRAPGCRIPRPRESENRGVRVEIRSAALQSSSGGACGAWRELFAIEDSISIDEQQFVRVQQSVAEIDDRRRLGGFQAGRHWRGKRWRGVSTIGNRGSLLGKELLGRLQLFV